MKNKLISVLLVLFWLVGCDPGTNGNGNDLFTVTFNSNGGSSVNKVSGISSGSTISLPNNPTKPNREFGGWYTDNKLFQNDFTEATLVNSNITVYAKWLITITTLTLKQWETNNSYTGTVQNITAETISPDMSTIHNFGNVGSITEGVLTIKIPELLPDQYLYEFSDSDDASPVGLKMGWIKFTPMLAPYKYYNDLEQDSDWYGGGLFYGSGNGSYNSSDSTVYEGWFYGANFADHPDHNLAYKFDNSSVFFTTKGYNWHIKNN
jgi:uncharacterized repeat protein (TIGR02543 family)